MWGRWGIPQNFLLAFIDGFWKTRKIRLLKKWKKLLEKTSFYTSVPKIIIICYTVPEIWLMMDVIVIFILGYTFPFYPSNSPKKWNFKIMKNRSGDITILQKCTKNLDHMLFYTWGMMCDICNCYFSFWAVFCPFNPPNSPKNNNFKKLKTPPGYIIILHLCTKNHDHMLYCSWDMVHDKCNCYFPFWPIFAFLPS